MEVAEEVLLARMHSFVPLDTWLEPCGLIKPFAALRAETILRLHRDQGGQCSGFGSSIQFVIILK
jgi:hypothetical protein